MTSPNPLSEATCMQGRLVAGAVPASLQHGTAPEEYPQPSQRPPPRTPAQPQPGQRGAVMTEGTKLEEIRSNCENEGTFAANRARIPDPLPTSSTTRSCKVAKRTSVQAAAVQTMHLAHSVESGPESLGVTRGPGRKVRTHAVPATHAREQAKA